MHGTVTVDPTPRCTCGRQLAQFVGKVTFWACPFWYMDHTGPAFRPVLPPVGLVADTRCE